MKIDKIEKKINEKKSKRKNQQIQVMKLKKKIKITDLIMKSKIN